MRAHFNLDGAEDNSGKAEETTGKNQGKSDKSGDAAGKKALKKESEKASGKISDDTPAKAADAPNGNQ